MTQLPPGTSSGPSRISSARSLDPLRRGVDVVGVEIVEPEGRRHRRGLGEHAADDLPSGSEELICACLADCRRPHVCQPKSSR